MSTKNDLLDSWCRWTGDPLAEARHRIRVLSEDGLLPQRAERLTRVHLATALLGFVASETHKDAAQIVRRLSPRMAGAISPNTPESLRRLPLIELISTALEKPFSLAVLSVQVASKFTELQIHHNHPSLTKDSNTQWEVYEFGFGGDTSIPHNKYPMTITRSLHFYLVDRLLTDLMPSGSAGSLPGHPAPVSARSAEASTEAAHPTLRGTGKTCKHA